MEKGRLNIQAPSEKDLYKTEGTRAWRNNNPGNISCSSFAKRKGSIGCDGIMAIFPDIDTGEKAQKSLLKSKTYRGRTIRKVVENYASKKAGNPTEKYIQYITEKSGLPETKKIRDMTDKEFEKFRGAMKKFENTTPGETKSGDDKPRFVPGKFQSKIDSGSSHDRFAKSKSSPTGESRTDRINRPAKSRARESSACKETLVREGTRVIRKEADCGSRGSFIS